MEPILIGTHIGSIRITRELGRGGMGVVYSGIDERLGRTVATSEEAGQPTDQIDHDIEEYLPREDMKNP